VVNSVWFWGGGIRQPVRARPYDAVCSDDAVATALASAAGSDTLPLPPDAAAWYAAATTRPARHDSHLVVIDSLSAAAAHHDAEAWRGAVAALEARWVAPLMHALRQGGLTRIILVVPGDKNTRRFELTRSDLLKIWRGARPLAEYA
jgi:hypothetical protein